MVGFLTEAAGGGQGEWWDTGLTDRQLRERAVVEVFFVPLLSLNLHPEERPDVTQTDISAHTFNTKLPRATRNPRENCSSKLPHNCNAECLATR